MMDNGADLCGNLPGTLRIPLREATEAEITYPDGRYGSLQEAVDALLPGGVLTLQVGEYRAGVTISKQVRIEAAGGAEVTLKGKSDKVPVLSLVGGAKLELVGLKVTDGEYGLLMGADAQVTISNSTLSGNGWDGIGLWGSARVIISGSSISENDRWGIRLWGSAQVTISDSSISENWWDGINLSGSARATISDSTLSGNDGDGIRLRDSAQATISNSTLSENWDEGIELSGSARATISDSSISGNGLDGIRLEGSARATIRQSILQGNGTDYDCQKPYTICNGIGVSGEAQVELINSQVLGNADWGVGAKLKQCGYHKDDFTGQVSFEGMELEDISGNNASGNQDGMGNPGDHPWNRPEVPDGQVCLP